MKQNVGVLQTFRSILAAEGARGLYAGLPATLLIAVPNNVLYFAAYEALRDRLSRQNLGPRIESMSAGISGGGARLVAATAISPLEVVRVRMQAGLSADEDPRRRTERGVRR